MIRTMSPRNSSNREGATIFMMLILLVVIFIFVAFAIDLGRVQLAQLKLQVASDFAARAGAEAMSRGVGDPSNTVNHEAAIRDEVNMVMQNNKVFGKNVDFDMNADLDFGRATANGNKFVFTSTPDGKINSSTNSLRVVPNLNQFPMLFGGFTGRDSLNLNTGTSVKVHDRDIVLVLDRSSSMFDHDAGTVNVVDYDANLMEIEDDLYGTSSPYHPSNIDDDDGNPNRHSEFEINNGVITLSRVQAIKLAVLSFRNEIDATRANEKLGLTSYNTTSSMPADVSITQSGGEAVDVSSGLSTNLFNQIIATGDEDCASALEDSSNGYDSFDFQYLRMRCNSNTNIAEGILDGTDILYGPGRRNYATPILIVMTDGNHNQSSTPEAAATTAKAAHPDLLIYTITFGSGASQAPMITVANTGEGRHAHANTVGELVDVFRDLATNAGVEVIE